MKLKDWCASEGIAVSLNNKGQVSIDNSPELVSYLETLVTDSVSPAVCEEGCEVEPDGYCEHGYPSLMLKCGII